MMDAPAIAPPPGHTAATIAQHRVDQVLDWTPLVAMSPGIGGFRPADPTAGLAYYKPTRVGPGGPLSPDDFRRYVKQHEADHAATIAARKPAAPASRYEIPGMSWQAVDVVTIVGPGAPRTYVVVQLAENRPFFS